MCVCVCVCVLVIRVGTLWGGLQDQTFEVPPRDNSQYAPATTRSPTPSVSMRAAEEAARSVQFRLKAQPGWKQTRVLCVEGGANHS